MVRRGKKAERGLPPIVLGHLMSLVSDAGIIQHCKLSEPDPRHGYSIDDQARGLIVASLLAKIGKEKAALRLADVTLSYIERAALAGGGFHNFMSIDGRWLDKAGSGDSFGRTIWALCVAARAGPTPEHSARCISLLESHLGRAERLRSPRAVAFSLLGCISIAGVDSCSPLGARRIGVLSAEKLAHSFQVCASADWLWFEEIKSYSNARLPESLFRAAVAYGEPRWAVVASRSLGFLMEATTVDGVFAPIGNNGWYRKDGKRALFDQQPIDTGAMVDACVAAYEVTSERKYLDFAVLAMDWYYGKNMLGLPMYEPWSGAVYDGLGEREVNLNQGSEPVLTYLMARINLGQHLPRDAVSSPGPTVDPT
jgi:hypothetical protein